MSYEPFLHKVFMQCYLDCLQQLMLKKGAAAALMECLRGYIGGVGHDDKCVECGCQALRGILMQQ